MSILRRFSLPLACAMLLLETACGAGKPDLGQLCSEVGILLQRDEYTHHKLDDEMSQRFLKNYLDILDFNHLFFTQPDIESLNAKYGKTLARGVLTGDLAPATDIYALYAKRVE